MTDRFSKIYEHGGWSNLGSGPGSSKLYNKKFLEFIEKFMSNNKINSVIDFGCGDFQMFRDFDFGNVDYRGYDVAENIIENNIKKFSRPKIDFHHAKDVREICRPAELFLIKDVFIHLPNEECMLVIEHAKSISKFVMVINDYGEENGSTNEEIEIGGYRPVDVSHPPLNQRAVTLLKYGNHYRRVRNFHSLRGIVFGVRVQSGRKHVQLIFGSH